jgi:hypothetical protein
VNALDVGELADSEGRTFAAVAGVLHAAERHAWIGADVLVDEAQPGLELLRRDTPPALEVGGDDSGAEAVFAVVGDSDGVGFVGGGDDRSDRAEDLFVVRWLAASDIGEDGCRVPGAGPVRDLAAEQEAGAAGDAPLDLPMHFVAGLRADHRPELGAFLARVAHFVGTHRRDEGGLEFLED